MAVRALVRDARANGSDELVLVKDGVLVGDWVFTAGRAPIQTMSITKSVLSLAVGVLVDAGKLDLDQPVSTWFPEWKSGAHAKITVRHLLSHTSGLSEPERTVELYRSRDFVAHALARPVEREPGTEFHYSNEGANLVSAVIARVSGERADRFVARTLFAPLGIGDFWWSLDRAGNAHGLAGLHLRPRELARLGELIDRRGRWEGRQIVSEGWLERSTAQLASVQPNSKRLGLFWWLAPAWTRVEVDDATVARWRDAGVDAAFIERVAPVRGKVFPSASALAAELRALFGDPALKEWTLQTTERGVPDARFDFGPIDGVYSAGTLGQYLVVLPRDHLVAVRMRRAPKGRPDPHAPDPAFPDFVERVQGLLR
ncbi:MAG: serine hydrolase [Deltaproteobacteria bacterium]|nr:serine hydrolase [Deltaproteobacteria bacterium]